MIIYQQPQNNTNLNSIKLNFTIHCKHFSVFFYIATIFLASPIYTELLKLAIVFDMTLNYYTYRYSLININ